MTKEEYAKLLQSDYWKGYSFSLIKERNFTCEDCGRKFLNERNKLQVHHLVYRDVNPWSYKPEELVVLCEDCHKKRHGIRDEQIYPKYSQTNEDGYVRSYSYSTDIKTEKGYDSPDAYGSTNGGLRGYEYVSHRSSQRQVGSNKRGVFIALSIVLLFPILFLVLAFCLVKSTHDEIPEQPFEEDVVETTDAKKNESATSYKSGGKSLNGKEDNVIDIDDSGIEPLTDDETLSDESCGEDISDRFGSSTKNDFARTEESTLENLERKNHADVVKRAQRAGVSTEESTLENLERKNHADVVKRAQRAGVSTEGSTLEILDRINHADVVKRAQRAGVSTEGSTLEILDRINHADVVKRAQRAGVSTDGSTLEILERITKKQSEKYNR
ncbi:MAG: HNH endonuclease [Bacteroidaceae bacterium]|nr:HNH endonuclease [Bacteroidaceae bacterium]